MSNTLYYDGQNEFETELYTEVQSILDMLISKNRKYKNSVSEPKRIFSKADPIEAINVRIDDKLSRIEQQTKNNMSNDEDTELDLCGYIILKRVVRKMQDKKDNKIVDELDESIQRSPITERILNK
jgi:guanylate kinase